MKTGHQIKWAQRKDTIYLTINLADVSDEKLTLTNDKVLCGVPARLCCDSQESPKPLRSYVRAPPPKQLVFAGKSNGKDYALDLEFMHPLNSEKSSWKVLQRSVQMVLAKEDIEADFWVRLLKDKTLEKTNVKIDWDKCVDGSTNVLFSSCCASCACASVRGDNVLVGCMSAQVR